MFALQGSVLEPLIRGTLMYLGLFILLRTFRRQAGSLTIADLLLIVIIADAAQNGMAGDAKSVSEALLLVGTIIFWDYFLDWLGFKSTFAAKLLEPPAVQLVKNGRFLRRNMTMEMITEDEILSQLRQQGIDDISQVELCCLESNGEFSVIKKGENVKKGNRQKRSGVS